MLDTGAAGPGLIPFSLPVAIYLVDMTPSWAV